MAVKQWTYSGNPATSDRDAVRYWVGDTNSDDKLVDDREIDYALSQYSGSSDPVIRASIDVASAIAAQFTRQTTYRIGQVSETLAQRALAFRRLAEDLRQKVRMAVAPLAPAIYVTDKETTEDDTDLVDPAFKVGMHDNTQGA